MAHLRLHLPTLWTFLTGKAMAKDKTCAEIFQIFKILHPEPCVVELRALRTRKGIRSGYFNNMKNWQLGGQLKIVSCTHSSYRHCRILINQNRMPGSLVLALLALSLA